MHAPCEWRHDFHDLDLSTDEQQRVEPPFVTILPVGLRLQPGTSTSRSSRSCAAVRLTGAKPDQRRRQPIGLHRRGGPIRAEPQRELAAVPRNEAQAAPAATSPTSERCSHSARPRDRSSARRSSAGRWGSGRRKLVWHLDEVGVAHRHIALVADREQPPGSKLRCRVLCTKEEYHHMNGNAARATSSWKVRFAVP